MKNFGLYVLGLLAIFWPYSWAMPRSVDNVQMAEMITEIPIVRIPEFESSGPLGPIEKPNDQVRGLVTKLDTKIQEEICEKLGGKPGEEKCKDDYKLTVLSFKKQPAPVAGVNYFVKVKSDDSGKIWNLRIYKEEKNNLIELDGVSDPKTEEDELVFFNRGE